ncbi:putative glycolipid-binding domain-containing protein [Crenobacter cavernae]|uniref:Uncharacterized protein n=1 Tax=Crenobacter cavernae TaxID=2290923 RepID=A0A345Y7K3_9NEIS|nr:putative glycolipid-binding domain-containing protein [Crenobacter cavernae]AXK39905.1 hypothetical protein DWG20_10880 [Crenobacter cavernae]
MPAVHYRWQQDGAAGREEIHASFSADAPRWQGKSHMEQAGAVLAYKIETDAAGVFSHAVLTLAEPARRTMTIERHADGEWLIDGESRPEFSAGTDIDVMDSDFTAVITVDAHGFVLDYPGVLRLD